MALHRPAAAAAVAAPAAAAAPGRPRAVLPAAAAPAPAARVPPGAPGTARAGGSCGAPRCGCGPPWPSPRRPLPHPRCCCSPRPRPPPGPASARPRRPRRLPRHPPGAATPAPALPQHRAHPAHSLLAPLPLLPPLPPPPRQRCGTPAGAHCHRQRRLPRPARPPAPAGHCLAGRHCPRPGPRPGCGSRLRTCTRVPGPCSADSAHVPGQFMQPRSLRGGAGCTPSPAALLSCTASSTTFHSSGLATRPHPGMPWPRRLCRERMEACSTGTLGAVAGGVGAALRAACLRACVP